MSLATQIGEATLLHKTRLVRKYSTQSEKFFAHAGVAIAQAGRSFVELQQRAKCIEPMKALHVRSFRQRFQSPTELLRVIPTGPLYAKSFDEAKNQDDTSKLTKEERLTYDYADAAVRLITAQIGGVLKTARPPGGQIDLSSTYFEEGDWKGIDFAEANLDGTWLSYTDLQDAEFRGVTRFDGATFYGTAWWEVKSINRPFLEYLKIKFPLKPGLLYGPRSESCSQEKYDAGISRFTSQLK